MVATGTLTSYAAVLATALTLGACSGGDPGPTQDGPAPTTVHTSSSRPTTTTSSSGSTSAAPTTTEDPVLAKIPKDARAETPQGAEAFVTYYFAQLNRAFREADPSVVETLTSKDCIVCNAMLEGVKDVRSKEQHYGSDLITVDSSSVMDFVGDKRRVLAQITQNPVKVLGSGGNLVETAPAGSGRYVFTLDYRDHWQVVRLQEAK